MAANFTCTIHSLAPGCDEAVQEWTEHMKVHADDAVGAIRDEGIDLELTLLDRRDEGDFLIFIMKTDDYDRAIEVFNRSTRPVDIYHRRFLERWSLGSRRLELLAAHEA